MTRDQQLELLKAGLTLAITLITLVCGWFIGLKLTVEWNLRQKRRELILANVQQLHAIYGEFKEISKVWRIVKLNKDGTLIIPPDCRWSLLARACAVESKNEAIMVKLATERRMTKQETYSLGLFRQAIQTLRESIHANEVVPSSSRGAEYVFFNELAAGVACIISAHRSETELLPQAAGDNLTAIVSIRSTQFKAAIADFKKNRPEY